MSRWRSCYIRCADGGTAGCSTRPRVCVCLSACVCVCACVRACVRVSARARPCSPNVPHVVSQQQEQQAVITSRLLIEKAKLTTVMSIVQGRLQTAASERAEDDQLHRSLTHEIERLTDTLGAAQTELTTVADRVDELSAAKQAAEAHANEMERKVAELELVLEVSSPTNEAQIKAMVKAAELEHQSSRRRLLELQGTEDAASSAAEVSPPPSLQGSDDDVGGNDGDGNEEEDKGQETAPEFTPRDRADDGENAPLDHLKVMTTAPSAQTLVTVPERAVEDLAHKNESLAVSAVASAPSCRCCCCSHARPCAASGGIVAYAGCTGRHAGTVGCCGSRAHEDGTTPGASAVRMRCCGRRLHARAVWFARQRTVASSCAVHRLRCGGDSHRARTCESAPPEHGVRQGAGSVRREQPEPGGVEWRPPPSTSPCTMHQTATHAGCLSSASAAAAARWEAELGGGWWFVMEFC